MLETDTMHAPRAYNTLAAEAKSGRVVTYCREESEAPLPGLESVAEYDHGQPTQSHGIAGRAAHKPG